MTSDCNVKVTPITAIRAEHLVFQAEDRLDQRCQAPSPLRHDPRPPWRRSRGRSPQERTEQRLHRLNPGNVAVPGDFDAAYHGQDAVAVAFGIGQAFQDQRGLALAEDMNFAGDAPTQPVTGQDGPYIAGQVDGPDQGRVNRA